MLKAGKEVNGKDTKFKVGDHVRISKYKTFLLKAILQIGLKKSLSLRWFYTTEHKNFQNFESNLF